MNPAYYMEPERFTVGSNEGLRYDDPPLECTACGQVVCTIEVGDDLAVLVMTANSHVCTDGPAEDDISAGEREARPGNQPSGTGIGGSP
jgi:hypothetical protein